MQHDADADLFVMIPAVVSSLTRSHTFSHVISLAISHFLNLSIVSLETSSTCRCSLELSKVIRFCIRSRQYIFQMTNKILFEINSYNYYKSHRVARCSFLKWQLWAISRSKEYVL